MHAASSSDGALGHRIGVRLTPRSLAPKLMDALLTLGYSFDGDDESIDSSLLASSPLAGRRVSTRRTADSGVRARRSIGAVLSLSEGGCRLRTRERLRKGSKMKPQFALPDFGLISTRAECRYTHKGDAGLAFSKPAPDSEQSIAYFVTLQLAEAGSHQGLSPPDDVDSA